MIIGFKANPSLILKVKLINDDGSQAGADITAGFFEWAPGKYRWTSNGYISTNWEGEIRIVDATDTILLRIPYVASYIEQPSGVFIEAQTTTIIQEGVQGDDGPVGPPGSQGLQGPQGIQGISGNTGSQGDPGAQGIQGIQGIQGLAGLDGRIGSDGAEGDDGQIGPPGLQGAIGSTGSPGATGQQGPRSYGPEGDQGDDGPMGPPGPAGRDGAGAVTSLTVAKLSVDVSNSTVTAAKITGLDLTLGVGTYVFQYFIDYQAALVTTGVKFSVNHTGTVTLFVTNMRYASTGGAAATGAPTQAGNVITGNIHESFSARAKSNAAGMGPTASVDAANSDMLMIIEGLMIVTVSGNIELWHASEVAAASTVKAGSSLIVTKTA